MVKDYPVKLSVAVATYNQEQYLSKALQSIFEQEHNYTFEVIICDDCSTDKTRDIIAHYQRTYPDIVKPILQERNVGVSKNGLQMLRSCSGEYIATLDGDDYWTDPDKIRKQISFLDSHPDFVLSCHRLKYHYQATDQFVHDSNDALFESHPDGFEFGTETLFEHWLAKTAAAVFRKSALDNTPQFETQRFFSDVTVFWAIASKGKSYAHNFVGGVYVIHSGGMWSGSNKLKQAAMAYQVAEQLLLDEPDNPSLKKFFNAHRSDMLHFQRENDTALDVLKVKNKNFTIISDDGWGMQVYKAFNLQELSPFIGINIYNADFLELISALKYNLSKPLKFIDASQSRHNPNFKKTFIKKYPIALLGDTIELHFVSYKFPGDAERKWNERITLINWNNLFFKMDVSRGDNISDSITRFESITKNCANRICFLDAMRIRDIAGHPFENSVHLMEYWNPESEILFPIAHSSFNLVGWLNGESGAYTTGKPFVPGIVEIKKKRQARCWIRYDDHYFIQFDETNIHSLTSYFHGSVTINFDEDQEVARINYNKSALEHARLSVKDYSLWDDVDLFLDLSKRENRHLFILAKGVKDHQLRVDFIAEDEHDDIHLNVAGLEQDIPEAFEWMHFDLSGAEEEAYTDQLFTEIKHFCLYVNPNGPAKGSLEIMAFYVGSVDNFNKIIAG